MTQAIFHFREKENKKEKPNKYIEEYIKDIYRNQGNR